MKIRTLIVDDEPLARERIRSLLKGEPDFEVVAECSNGTEAVAAVKEKRPDLVFLDIQMPGMDGFQFVNEKRQLPHLSQIPVIIYSGHYDAKANASRLGASAYLQKPFDVENFLNLVRHHC